MTERTDLGRNSWQRLALLLVGCALLLRIAVPAGWMPQVSAGHVTLSWCADSGFSGGGALAEAKALLADAVGKPAPAEHKASDQPCAFAMAAQPIAPPAPVILPQLLPAAEPVRHVRFEAAPGRGLAAPPPLSTGPPRLA
ncbi:hypothetical protein [Sphingomonas sp. LM7]|uniref:hypothetical protein n=1 Tax=Sphingomonas sp. LM7 TaxID=1938607 RepID=UPI00098395BA|nr:hypothetical protein [Sphingomonas sp. LM7]AQR72912.1 hypothetical protein BXU08_03785 [Sphingomonas sp. LM7]